MARSPSTNSVVTRFSSCMYLRTDSIISVEIYSAPTATIKSLFPASEFAICREKLPRCNQITLSFIHVLTKSYTLPSRCCDLIKLRGALHLRWPIGSSQFRRDDQILIPNKPREVYKTNDAMLTGMFDGKVRLAPKIFSPTWRMYELGNYSPASSLSQNFQLTLKLFGLICYRGGLA